MTKTQRSGCPISLALEVFGDRWTMLILRDMVFAGKHSYSELVEAEEGIATNVLRDRLNDLVEAGIIDRVVSTEDKRRVDYRLTEAGIDLIPVMIHIGEWGQKWLPASDELGSKAHTLFEAGPRAWKKLMAEQLQQVS